MSRAKVTYCPLLPPEVYLTADFAYFRWHGHGEDIWFDYRYSKDELEPWAHKVQETAGKVKKIYGYSNNHYHGYAPENCLQLIERLGLLSEEQKKAKAKNAIKQVQLGSPTPLSLSFQSQKSKPSQTCIKKGKDRINVPPSCDLFRFAAS